MKKLLKEAKRNIDKAKNIYIDSYLFIHINKTGGTSIEKALNIPLDHKTALEVIKEIGQARWNRKLTFTAVRNPWDKLVSQYHYRIKTNQTNLRENPLEFKEWIKRIYVEEDSFYYDQPKMFMPQMEWITDENGEILVKEIIHFENLEKEFNELLYKIGKKNITLSHVKRSNRGNYREYYDSKTAEIVQNIFKRDIEEFGYKF